MLLVETTTRDDLSVASDGCRVMRSRFLLRDARLPAPGDERYGLTCRKLSAAKLLADGSLELTYEYSNERQPADAPTPDIVRDARASSAP